MKSLPDDLVGFLRAERQLEYDASNCEIGPIEMIGAADIALTFIDVYTSTELIFEDPYADLTGAYEVEVVDLVAASEHYEPEGLLCWIPAIERFATVDAEHGNVISFPGASWEDIVAQPVAYLDSQWGWEGAETEKLLPWLYFPFKLNARDTVLNPYPEVCPVHGKWIGSRKSNRSELFEILKRRELDDWLRNYLAEFPHSGVHVCEGKLLCCADCRSAEDAWLQTIDDAIVVVEATPSKYGVVKCPGCGIRFTLHDEDRFDGGRHLTCGQKINIIGETTN